MRKLVLGLILAAVLVAPVAGTIITTDDSAIRENIHVAIDGMTWAELHETCIFVSQWNGFLPMGSAAKLRTYLHGMTDLLGHFRLVQLHNFIFPWIIIIP